MTLPAMDNVKKIVKSIQMTRDHELGCADCFAVLDQFIEMVMQGKDAAEVMPLVQEHLDRCGDCDEEFQALLVALEAAS